MRYLKSRDWNVDEAEKMLRNTIEFRRRTNVIDIDCRWCHERPRFHTMVRARVAVRESPQHTHPISHNVKCTSSNGLFLLQSQPIGSFRQTLNVLDNVPGCFIQNGVAFQKLLNVSPVVYFKGVSLNFS